MSIKDQVYIGHGFDWEPTHAQIAREVMAHDKHRYEPPKWVKKILEMRNYSSSRDIHGSPWIHGIGMEQDGPQFMEADDLGSHIGILGTTGAGKGVLLQLFIAQAIHRGEALIIVDPKYDVNMVNRAYGELKRLGKEDKFFIFTPAYAETVSCRINPMSNYSRLSQLADRIISLLLSDGSDFQNFARKTMDEIIHGMVLAGKSPNLIELKRYIDSGVGLLLQEACANYFEQNNEYFRGWKNEISTQKNRIKNKSKRGITNEEAATEAYIAFYQDKVMQTKPNQVIEGLISILLHPHEHFQKMILNIQPILSSLTSGELGPLLTPDYLDGTDHRPIKNLAEICRKGEVLYIALDALADGTTAQHIGALLMADITSVAAERYNYEAPVFGEQTKVNIIVDELSNSVSEQLIHALSKIRGAGMGVIWATQTVADLSVRFGTKDRAMQILGNVNTMIGMRSKDTETKELLADKMGQTRIQSARTGHNTSTKTDSETDFARSTSTMFSGVDGEALFPENLFDELPDLQYMIALPDGKRKKMRIPWMPIEEELKFPTTHLSV